MRLWGTIHQTPGPTIIRKKEKSWNIENASNPCLTITHSHTWPIPGRVGMLLDEGLGSATPSSRSCQGRKAQGKPKGWVHRILFSSRAALSRGIMSPHYVPSESPRGEGIQIKIQRRKEATPRAQLAKRFWTLPVKAHRSQCQDFW